MLFTDSFIDELKQRLPISRVISSKVKLARSGPMLKGLCPFHNEKTPSFTVHDHKAMYYCFGCHASGDVIRFVTETENIGFNEAVKKLAAMAGMELPKFSKKEQEAEKQRASLIDVVAKANEWFAKQLKLSTNYHALEYLQKRGLNEHDIKTFSLGYSPAKGLLSFLNKSGFNEDLAVEAGLAIKTENNDYIERFRNRVIFPIHNQKNQVVGFGGRTLSAEIMPKYLNSPETPLFKKNNLLYAANIAYKHSIKSERVIVVEGYMDAIYMHKAGLQETVAALGTAFNAKHLQLLWRLANEPVLCFDGDTAGKKAMLKAAHTALPILEPGLTLKFCFLPQGKDPDELIRQNGASYINNLVNNSSNLADFIWNNELELSKPNSPERRALFEHKIYEYVKQIKNPIVATHYRQFMRDKLWQEFNQRKTYQKSIVRKAQNLPLIANLSTKERLNYSLFAQIILRHELLEDPFIFENFTHFETENSELEDLRAIIYDYYENNEDKALNDLLIENNLGKLLEFLCGNESSFVDQISKSNLETAKIIWILTYKKYTLELLKNEYNQLMLKVNNDNKIYSKTEELKKSIDALAQEISQTENNL